MAGSNGFEPLAGGDPDPSAGTLVLVGGDKPGLALAVAARRRGIPVAVVEPSGVFGLRVGIPGRARAVYDAEQAGAVLETEVPETGEVFDVRPAPPITVGHLGAHLVGDVTGTWGIEPAFQQARVLAALLSR